MEHAAGIAVSTALTVYVRHFEAFDTFKEPRLYEFLEIVEFYFPFFRI